MNQNNNDNFKIQTEQFADIRILRYRVPGFEELDKKQKIFMYLSLLQGVRFFMTENL